MIKRITARATVAIGMLVLAAGPAQATDGPAFSVAFYSDASHSNQVGFARFTSCEPQPYATLQWGYSTNHQEVIYIGECVNGQLHYW